MNADGGGQRILTASPSSEEIPAAWSPDGRSIAFATNRDGNWEIYAVDADGSNPRNLTRNPLSDGNESGFAWSPDGRRIVFGTNRDRNRVRPGGKSRRSSG
jgi:TolB protein